MLGIRKYDPFETLTREFDRMLRRPFDLPAFFEEENADLATWHPRMDVVEKDKEIIVKMDIPGMKQDDIKVTLEDNVLTISGERKFEKDDKKDNYHRVERFYGNFTRSFTLPLTVDSKKINATYKNGVLELVLPKKEETQPKQINIKIE